MRIVVLNTVNKIFILGTNKYYMKMSINASLMKLHGIQYVSVCLMLTKIVYIKQSYG